MITRAIKDGEIVWFGSYGKNPNGTAKFYDENKNSFVKEQQSVDDCLTQQLAILRGELWYRIDYGIPLFDKIKSKTLIDAYVLSVVTSHPDVLNVEHFLSTLDNHKYTCNMTIISVYGKFILQI